MSLDVANRASWSAIDRKVAGAVSRGLHDAAQPLTVLQGLLELMLQAKSESDHKGSVVHAIEQLRRVSNSFDHLRRLIRLQEPAEDVVEITASALVKEVVQELQTSFVTSGVKCVAKATNAKMGEDLADHAIKVSRSRTTLALRLVLTTLLSRMQSGDNLSVSIESAGPNVVVHILPETNCRMEPDAMSARFDLAHTLVVSTGGEFRRGRVPCSMDILLPSASIVAARSNTEKMRSMHV
ncbi:MAG: hypothetical protein LAO56_02360 [Acidobacteriia bacterium]|nr:hypothetical protein [Terriglobia bacterium]